ncbi:MAG: bifunctional folylpolyglutamate synthase/dihydrofolate synthase [Algoriphagus sp.]|uniref:bifunctional folylpolyglutamate synthase/dihydrofolate synthase n=1 Tax=Algoriphagus sp. TaxID=1872435 RepID=UPI00260E3BAD|nr:folylpolyglutamate synthase/dihydrofolate synthase family protein [Algoriphagus sp.]MDG1278436.1 bifunctional folylpolyglutamate synthase/dihydrofolate synthase [Algoriphagus sp.]
MNFQETLDYLFNSLPNFQRVGAPAYKNDLNNTLALCAHLGNPERQFKSVHVAGTNGKGSSSHSIAAILQSAGYKTGLYTSPHLKSFTERIRVDGIDIPEEEVVKFVAENKSFLEDLKPSFFEMTVAMAFWYFAKVQVDIAVIEVGMGGRLDSTNVITPELSLITNIGYDHMQFLGDTLALISGEKAGIIKPNVPVVISETHPETRKVFLEKAASGESPITFADQVWLISNSELIDGKADFFAKKHGYELSIQLDLIGAYQRFNLPGILESIETLRSLGWKITDEQLKAGLSNVTGLTHLKGRWQILQENPLMIADTGHNEPGMKEVLKQLKTYSFNQLWMVIGMVQDKDIHKILELFPKTANYIFVKAQIPRAMPAETLAETAATFGLKGEIIPDINEAIAFARKKAKSDDLIFIGGSTFVVAEIDEI